MLVLLALWLNGHYWRSQWSLKPTRVIRSTTTGDPGTLVIMLTGAFTDGPIQFERLVPLYQQVGDVYVVRYAAKRFNAHEAMREAYEYARCYDYETVVLVGASLGGEVALRFIEHNRSLRDDYYPFIKLVACDVPLGGQHLPVPALVQWIIRHIHVGPLINLLSSFVTRRMFKTLETDEVSGVSIEHRTRHMKKMWQLNLSAMAEQIGAMVIQPPFTNVADVPTVYLKCENDEVIRGDEAANDWRELVGDCLLDMIEVEGGHVQLVENHNAWYFAHLRALETFGYVVE